MVNLSTIKLALLVILIIVFIVLAPLLKKNPTYEPFQASADGGIPTDADNPNISENGIYGEVPSSASISIFKKAEARGVTANPDALEPDGKTGEVMVTLTEIPDQPPDPQDIETQLNETVEGFLVKEGFQGALAQEAVSRGVGAAFDRSGLTGAIGSGGATAGGAAAAAVGGGAAGAVATKGTELAQAELQGRAQAKAEDKVMDLVTRKSKKVVAKAQQARKIAVRGAKRVATKISNKLSQRLGKTVIGRVLANVARKVAEIVGKKAAIAGAQGAAMSSTGIGAAVGILLSVIAAIGLTLQIAIAGVLKGDEGVCDEGWTRVSEKWPSFLDNIPLVGDIMGVLAPYICYKDSCNPDEEESAGLCYPPCRPGFKSDKLTMCWKQYPEFENNGMLHTIVNITKKTIADPGVPLDRCNADEDRVGALCYEKTPAGWTNVAGTIWQNCPAGHTDTGAFCDRTITVGVRSPSYGGCAGGYRTEPLTCFRDASCSTRECGRHRGLFGEDWGPKLCTSCQPPHSYSRSIDCGADELIGALCYPRCPAGTSRVRGVPNSCSGTFAKQSRVLAPRPLKCAPGLEQKGLLCYKPPPPGYSMPTVGINSQNCPPGAKDIGVACERESYNRGVGKPKLKLQMVKPTPPPPPPPPSHFSSYFADDPATKCFLDFSSTKALGDMAQFYYRAARINADENSDGTISFSYITKITKVVASSEQSCDILCDITTVNMNNETGKTNTSTTTSNNDRRFYFAIIDKTCSFIVTAATNMNDTAPDVKNPDNQPKDVSFVPTIDRCKDLPISLKRCQNPKAIDDMIAMYKKTQAPTVRVKSIVGAQNLTSNTCGVTWSEVTYDPSTNMESSPVNKTGIFTFTQDTSNDACAYTLQRYDPASPETTIKSLETPLTRALPLPAETTLQGCPNKCSNPAIVTKMINAFNAKPGNANRILSVRKAFTSNPLRCDVEADVYVRETKQTEVQRIRFDMAKDGNTCVFNVARVGDGSSGTFIQANTPELDSTVNTSDFIVSQAQSVLKSAETKLGGIVSQMSGFLGKSNVSFEKSLADAGQIKTLGNCAKKCSDPDVLEAIATHYNNANYPRERMNVTKKTMERVLKAATSSAKTCDLTFEEKQEQYVDLYTDAPKVNIVQKTQRFTMKQGEGCTFTVDAPVKQTEGFQTLITDGDGLPGMSRFSFVNSQSPMLTPPFSGKGCELDCTKVENMNSMRDLYSSQNIEGFQTMKARRMSSKVREAYQDFEEEVAADEGVTDWEAQEYTGDYYYEEEQPVFEEEQPVYEEEEGYYEEEQPVYEEKCECKEEEQPAFEEEPAYGASVSRTFKQVNEAFKVSPDTCEYEVRYDRSSTDEYGNVNDETDLVGYFRTTFTKDPNGCTFQASSVSQSEEPILPSVPQNRKQIINYSF